MKKLYYSLFYCAGVLGATMAWSAEVDRMRDLESLSVESNEVQRAENSALLKEHLSDVKKRVMSKGFENVEIARIQQAEQERNVRIRILDKRLRQTHDAGGEAALAIQKNTTRQLLEKEGANSFGATFTRSLQYWTEEGFYNAGFAGGWAAGNEIFGHDAVRIPFAPHHGRKTRE